MGSTHAVKVIADRALAARDEAELRWVATAPGAGPLEAWIHHFRVAGRLTLNFHPDRLARSGLTAAAGLASEGSYKTQWVTGVSGGSRSAVRNGERQRFEHEFFAGAYDSVAPSSGEHPVYGSFDMLFDEHGGSPRFGSSYLILAPHVRDRTTLCLGDSHVQPGDVGTFSEPSSICAGLAEQASRHDLLNRHLGTDVLLDALNGSYQLRRASRDLDGYVEIQVHGGISLRDDVEAIVLDPSFRGTDVDRDLTNAAKLYGCKLSWHVGSVLAVNSVPNDFRGPTMSAVARRVAGPEETISAHAIGLAASRERFDEPTPLGDSPDSILQQLKYLWHTLLAHGHDTPP